MMTNEELIAFVKKNPISVGCGVLALAMAGAIYFRAEEIPSAEIELAQKTAEAERYALNINYAAQLKEHLDALVAANKEVDARLVRVGQLGTNTQFFYKLQSETGVKLVDFRQNTTTAAKTAKSAFVPVSFAVSIQGTLPQLLDFLRQLEGGAHYARILTATCGANPSQRNFPLTMSLTLELLGLP